MFIFDNTAYILIHDEVTTSMASNIIHFIAEVDQMPEIDTIEVSINSPGGSVMGGYSIFSALVNSEKTVRTIIAGIAASIAGIIFLAGEEREAMSHSMLMIHNPSGGDDKVLNKIKESLMVILSKEGIDNLSRKMSNETWFNVDEMVEMGILTKVIDVEKGIKIEKTFNDADELYAICNQMLTEKYKNMVNEQEEIVDEIVNETINEEINEEVVDAPEVAEAVTEEVEEKTEEVVAESEEVAEEVVEEVVNETEEVKSVAEIEVENLTEIKALNAELLETNNKLAAEVEELKNKLAEYTEEKAKQEKIDYLNKRGIEITNTWLNLDIDVIKELSKAVNVASPKVEFKNSSELTEKEFNKMSKDEKLNLLNSDPELYKKLFLKK